MTRFSHVVSLGLALLGLAACGAPPAPAPASSENLGEPRDQLGRIVERYWDEHTSFGDAISAQSMADSLAVERRFLAEVLAVPRTRLDMQSKLTYDIFRRRREIAIEGFTYPAELLPIDPFGAVPLKFARRAADTELHPLSKPADYEHWLRSIDDYARWTQQAIANMRDGMRRGYTSPRVLIEQTLPELERLGEDTSASVFYAALRTMPDTIKDPERSRLAGRLAAAVKDKLLPSYRALHDFLQREYLPRARVGVALSALPLGDSWYAYRIERATGARLAPNEIHVIGMAEVERIRVRMQAPLAGLPQAAGAQISTGKDELLSAYADLKVQARAAIPTLFAAAPHADFEIRAADPFLIAAAPVFYRRAAPEGTPAVLYVGTGNAAARPAIAISDFLQEALPGRHFQLALQQERSDLPRFRRFGGEPAFVDGWGLYAASLGEELGLYRDEEAKMGALSGQMRCAVALVVDTGLHAEGWTLMQALDYIHGHLAVDDAEANLLVDRYVAFPGDALACKIGELKIQELRARAQQALGTRFDVREFHSEILKDGAMPLDILDAKVKLWMESMKAGPET